MFSQQLLYFKDFILVPPNPTPADAANNQCRCRCEDLIQKVLQAPNGPEVVQLLDDMSNEVRPISNSRLTKQKSNLLGKYPARVNMPDM